ncbi:hypothetical protein F4804DRAFT_352616 [Jackrogersella minutella]|nr:hypothetical protein F4804DRAFT_352616 [Jackrogersella minutella]
MTSSTILTKDTEKLEGARPTLLTLPAFLGRDGVDGVLKDDIMKCMLAEFLGIYRIWYPSCHVEFPGNLANNRFCQKVATKSKIRTPLLTGRLPLDFDEEAIYGRSAVILLGLFVPCEALLAEKDAGPDELWSTLKQRLSPRLQFISNNFNLMKKSKEDAIKDVKMWDARADSDEVINANDAEDIAGEEEAADDETDEVKDSKNIQLFRWLS